MSTMVSVCSVDNSRLFKEKLDSKFWRDRDLIKLDQQCYILKSDSCRVLFSIPRYVSTYDTTGTMQEKLGIYHKYR